MLQLPFIINERNKLMFGDILRFPLIFYTVNQNQSLQNIKRALSLLLYGCLHREDF